MKLEKDRAYRYIELCEYFGEDVKSGSSKTAQINRWRKYINFEKVSIKYLIREVYDTPLETPKPKRGVSAMNKVGDDRLQHFDVPYEDWHKSGIYKIYNAETNEIYIGQTKDFQKAFRTHWGNHDTLTYKLLHNGAIFSVVELCEDRSLRRDKQGDYVEMYRKSGYYCVNLSDSVSIKENPWMKIMVRKADKNKIEELLQNNNIEYIIK